MSKKRVQFDVEDEEDESNPDEQKESKLPFNKKFKHTLDSDESDDELEDEKKYEFNEKEVFDGEEEGNLHRDGEITITPFNIKDELKEGHFDNEGMFIFKKDTDEIKDNWIDNIDWVEIKDVKPATEADDAASEEKSTKIDFEDCLKKLIELMNPNETVQKAIQRLGKSKLKNVNRNRNKNKQKKSPDQSSAADSKEEQEEKERKDKLNSLLELSNELLNNGDMNIYETKYETLKYQLDERLKGEDLGMFAD